jgi:uncharacterized protein (UPF0305 family)
MIPNDLQERQKIIDRMMRVCTDKINELSKWETDFILSIETQYETKGNLTDRQCEILEKIYDKL